ncbi:MAG: metal ABC transporter permease [Pseudomonadota bacterium]
MDFLQSHFLWLDIVIAATMSAAAAAAVGVHAILRRVVFLPAALSQLAGVGVVASFLVAHNLDGDWHGSILEAPKIFAIVFAAVGAIVLGLMREARGTTREWGLGGVYIASSALIVLIGGHIPQEIHDVNDILFGNAIAIEREQMATTAIVSSAVLLIHAALARPFVATAFDQQTASAHRVPVRSLDVLLFVSMGLAAATSTRVVGALPAFAFAVFPGACALRLARDARAVVAIAAGLGVLDAFLGYWASFVLSLPTGACMAAMALAVFIVVRAVLRAQRLLGWLFPRRTSP